MTPCSISRATTGHRCCRHGPTTRRTKPRQSQRCRSSNAGSWRACAQQFASVNEVNQAIAPLLSRLNEKPFQKLPGSRASAFAGIDAPALAPLPLQRYEMAHFKTIKVHIDYHVEIERHRYSVPHSLVGQVLEARITAAAVEILHRGNRVASHARNRRVGGYIPPPPRTCRRRTAPRWNGRRNG